MFSTKLQRTVGMTKLTRSVSRYVTDIKTKQELVELSSQEDFDGHLLRFQHWSPTVNCMMRFAIFLPPQAKKRYLPVLYFLPGMNCDEQYVFQRTMVQKYATRYGMIIVSSDTSPRGCQIDCGNEIWKQSHKGNGFYIDSPENPWKKNYRMFSYVNMELTSIVESNFPVQEGLRSIFGHSMGGSGALISSLKNPGYYLSVSAFAPVCNPVCSVPENVFPRAFSIHFGTDRSKWRQWDACELLQTYRGPLPSILISQGTSDTFLHKGELLPENFIYACQRRRFPLTFKKHERYGHFGNLLSTFIKYHIRFHKKYLVTKNT